MAGHGRRIGRWPCTWSSWFSVRRFRTNKVLRMGANLAAWRAIVAGAAVQKWLKPLLTGHLKAIIINFYAGNRPSVDVDNMSKPILDEMEKIVYDNDRQIIQAEITYLRIGAAFSIAGVSKVLVTA